MRYPKLRELKEAIIALIKGPYTSKFPFEPHTPEEGFRGKPEFTEEDCVGCGACHEVCPPKAIEYSDDVIAGEGRRTLSVNLDLCIMCGQCERNCLSEKGIKLTPEFDLACIKERGQVQKIEKELVLCESCKDIVAPVDQLLWVTKKLGTLSFSNTSLILLYLRKLNLSLSKKPSPKEKSQLLRSDRIKVLCPKCRREAVLKS